MKNNREETETLDKTERLWIGKTDSGTDEEFALDKAAFPLKTQAFSLGGLLHSFQFLDGSRGG